MSCSPFDLKDYFLKELPDPQRRLVEEHVRACRPCREELDRLGLTEAALFTLRDEEVPQRIAFVSDKVFEPAPWRRWLNDFWGSTARLGFASAAMLSAAILTHGLLRQAPAPVTAGPAVQASFSPDEVEAMVRKAVDRAVRESEERQVEKTQLLVADFVRREERDRRLMQEANRYLERQSGAVKIASFRPGAGGGVAQ